MSWETIDPRTESRWNQWIASFEDATCFHTAGWANVLAESYGYQPCYAVLRDGERLAGIVPLMDVRSLWTGNRGVCLPFSDECVPLLIDPGSLATLGDPLRALRLQHGWQYLELRGPVEGLPDAVPSQEFLTHRLALERTDDLQFRKLKDSTRRNVQKARRDGVEVVHLHSPDAVAAFYSLHCLTRRRHGVPPQPARFFHHIQKFILEPGNGFVSLARFQGHWIAAAVFFHFGSRAVYKFGASDLNFQYVRANNLLMWEAIAHFRGQGAREFSFGRSDPGNAGLLQFKRGWGAEENTLHYYRMGISQKVTAKNGGSTGNTARFLHAIMQRMPLPVLRLVGGVIYRHIN